MLEPCDPDQVRSAESIRDGLLYLLRDDPEADRENGAGADAPCVGGVTGAYLHVDEFDEAVAAGRPEAALKLINERPFECTTSA